MGRLIEVGRNKNGVIIPVTQIRRSKKTRRDYRYLSHVQWTLRRSRIRKDIFRYLLELYPGASYVAEIARQIGSTPSNVRCALSGAPWGDERFNGTYSLEAAKLVEMEEVDGRRYYKATKRGLKIARELGLIPANGDK